jgi:hypothetical protein
LHVSSFPRPNFVLLSEVEGPASALAGCPHSCSLTACPGSPASGFWLVGVDEWASCEARPPSSTSTQIPGAPSRAPDRAMGGEVTILGPKSDHLCPMAAQRRSGLGANGAGYTSLGQCPRYADPNEMRRLKARSISLSKLFFTLFPSKIACQAPNATARIRFAESCTLSPS